MTPEKKYLPQKNTFWQRLVEPSASLTDENERRFARVLATLLLVLLPLYFLPEGIRATLEKHALREIAYFILGVFSLSTAYVFSRSKYPRWGARITLVYFSIIPFLSLLTYPERYGGAAASNALIWTLPVLVIALILLHPNQIKWAVLFNIGLYLIIPALWSHVTYAQVLPTLWLVISVGGLLIVSAYVRNRYMQQIEEKTAQNEFNATRYREIFFSSPVALVEVDFSAIKKRLDRLYTEHGETLFEHISTHPELMEGAASSVVVLDVNQAALELYETSDVALLKQSVHHTSGSNELFSLRDGILDLWQKKKNNPIEMLQKTLEGNTKNVIVRFAAGIGYEETWERVIISIVDITKQKEAEASARLLASAVEASASSVVMTDVDGNIEYVNPAFERVTGYSAAEALGNNPRILKSDQHPAEFYEEMWQKLTDGQSWQGELVNKKKNGESYWEMATISPIQNDAGKVHHYVAVKDDISKLKEADERIRQQSQFLQSVMDGIDSPFYVLNVDDYSIAMANNAAKKSGIHESKTCYGLTHHLDAPCSGDDHPCPLQYVVNNKKPFVVEHKHFREDGTFYDVEVHGYPIYDTYGNIVQMIEYSLDISARKTAERRIERLLQEQISVRKALETITSSLDVSTVLHKLAEELGSAVDATSTYILLWDEESRTSRMVSVYFSKSASESERLSDLGALYKESDDEFIVNLRDNRFSVDFIDDLDEDTDEYKHLLKYGAKSVLYIPIHFNNQPIAFAEIWESRLRREFTPDEIVLCQHIAQNAAVAINNAGNYEQAQLEIQRRKEVERELRKLSNAAEQTASGIVITNKEGVIEFANPAASYITGYSADELIGETPNILKSGMHDKEFYDDLWFTVQRGDTWRGELINRRKDGSHYWESQVISPVKDSAGNVTHYVAVKEDITQRKESAKQLRYLSNATEQTISGIVISNAEGLVEYVNPAFTKITGYTLDDLQGRNLEVQRSGQHPKSFYDELDAALESGEIWKGEIINRRRDGSTYWEAMTVSPIRNDDGEITHRVFVKEDISFRKDLEKALTLAHEEALAASDMKTQLLANVSHDMRTPLGAILGYTEMLQTGVFAPLNNEQNQAMRAISSSAQRLLDFVNNLLSQAQIDTGKIVLNKSLFKPKKLITTMGGELSFARSKGLNVEIEISPELPDLVEGDAYWTGQILHNLVSNAIKFTPNDGTLTITLSRCDEAHWSLAVSDTGKGIPVEAQEYIFESFRQVDGSIQREAHTGSGLGLSIVKHLVRLMDGDIQLESEIGKGSTFTVILPLNESEEN